jgi:hypothetical protein
MEHFYDGQLKRYLTQFMRLMSNFSYKDGKGKLVQVPVRFGDMNRQVAQIVNKNSENIIQSAPFIACYIKELEFARDRLQDPTYVSKINIRERAFDSDGQEYLNTQGANYTVERIMPTPFNLKLVADIWCTNVDQKLQLIEQLAVLFNPAIEIQTTNNYLDWTSLSYVELTGITYSSRQIPQGLEQDIDIATMTFQAPIWITPPAKVKKLGIITKIITSIFDEAPATALRTSNNGDVVDFFGDIAPLTVEYTTLGNLGLMVMDNTAKLIRPYNVFTEKNSETFADIYTDGETVSWHTILDQYPGKFTANLSQIRLQKPDGNEIVGFISLSSFDDFSMQVRWDTDTVPMNTLFTDVNSVSTRGTVDAIIDPQTFNPRPRDVDGSLQWPTLDTRYLLLEDVAEGAIAWKNQNNSYFSGKANDIVQWDGTRWNILFNHTTNTVTFITNARTGIQYKWTGSEWLKSYEGIYNQGKWRLVL